MLSNPEKDQIMSKQPLMKECKIIKDKLIVKADGLLQTVPMDLQMEMGFKLLVEVLIK